MMSDASVNAEISRLRQRVEVLERALEMISELNMMQPDEDGHRWANSDLIDQEIVFARMANA
jgi:hypothetical protein